MNAREVGFPFSELVPLSLVPSLPDIFQHTQGEPLRCIKDWEE